MIGGITGVARRERQGAVVGALLMATAAASGIVATPAAAQTREAARSFDIPAQPLAQALMIFGRQSGLQVTAEGPVTDGLSSSAVKGEMLPAEALSRLLTGTGLTFRFVGNNGVQLERAPEASSGAIQLGPVRVEGDGQRAPSGSPQAGARNLPPAYAGGQIATGGRVGMLGNRDVMDTPFATTAFTSQTAADIQATTIADVVRLDPSVRSSGVAGDNADAFFVRGLPIGDNNIGEISFDGLFGAGPNYRLSADYAERIEILKGPAAMLYGMSPNGAGGGTINVVPKRAQSDLVSVRGDYVGDSQFGGHVDVAHRFGGGREFGVRFNGTYQDGDTAIDHQARMARVGALALDYQDERLRITLDLIDQREDIDAPTRRPRLAAGVAAPEAPDGRRNITQAWEYSNSHEQSGMLRLEYEANEWVSVFAGAAKSKSVVDRLFNTPSITNAAGDTTVRPSAGTFDIRQDSLEAGVRGHFDTGSVTHRITLQASRYSNEFRRGLVNGQTYTSNIYQPIDRPAQDVALPATTPMVSENILSGVALSYSLSAFDERLEILTGLRRQNVDTTNYAADGVTVTEKYDQHALTPMFGVIFKPRHNISIYANYIEGLAKGDTAPTIADNAGQVFAPYRSKQYEAGVKFDNETFMTTLSAFQITRPSGQLTNNIYAVDGEQRNRGLELSFYGAPVKHVRVFGGVTWIDAKLTHTSSAATQGNTAVGVPRIQASLTTEWDVPIVDNFTLMGSVIHSGKQYVDQANTQQIPSWTTLDLGARYTTRIAGKSVVWRANLRNVFDKNYWAGVSTFSTLAVGEPRTLRVSATVDF